MVDSNADNLLSYKKLSLGEIEKYDGEIKNRLYNLLADEDFLYRLTIDMVKKAFKLSNKFNHEFDLSEIIGKKSISIKNRNIIKELIEFLSLDEISFYSILEHKIVKKSISFDTADIYTITDYNNLNKGILGLINNEFNFKMDNFLVSNCEDNNKKSFAVKINDYLIISGSSSKKKIELADLTDFIINISNIIHNKYSDLIGYPDQLTGLIMRKGFEFLHLFYDEGAIVMFDIDHFKNINDTFGHNIGDIVLKKIAKIIKLNTKESDLVVRWGGEEILLFLPNLVDKEQVFKIVERIRKEIENYNFEQLDGKNITVSAGISIYNSNKPELMYSDKKIDYKKELFNKYLEKADIALYHSKENGRNRITFYEEKK